MRKGSFSTIDIEDCSTLQTSKPNHPTTYTYINTHTNNSQSMHACIHSFIHSFNPPYSLYHSFTRTNQASPLPFITIIHPSINQSLTMHCTNHSVWHSYMHAWRCHYSHTMECISMHTACQPSPYRETYIHTCMHRDENDKNDDDGDALALFLPPTESADEHLRWRWKRWWWW